MKAKVALVLGASGSVGGALLQALLDHHAYEEVVVSLRRPLSEISSPKLQQKILPQLTESELRKSVAETLREFSSYEVRAFSALGIGANTAALTIDEHRAVDVELNRAFAEAVNQPLVESLSFLSAIGANPDAKTTGSGAAGMPRYARVKGEAEEAVKKHGPKVVHIFRPAMIRGSQHTPKILESAAPLMDWIAPKKYHSISTQQLAQAMVAVTLRSGVPSGVFNYPEMMDLIEL